MTNDNKDNQFKQMYLAEFPDLSPLTKLVIQYHTDCDLYDNTVCPPDGKPRSGTDLYNMQQNASTILKKLSVEAEAVGYSRSDLVREIQKQRSKLGRRCF